MHSVLLDYLWNMQFIKKNMSIYKYCIVCIILTTITILTFNYHHKMIKFSTAVLKENTECVVLLKDYSQFPVSEPLLSNLIRECKMSGQLQERLAFQSSFLKTHLEHFNCTRSYKYIDRSPLALASFPGSGNGMTKWLIRAVTGMMIVICVKKTRSIVNLKRYVRRMSMLDLEWLR